MSTGKLSTLWKIISFVSLTFLKLLPRWLEPEGRLDPRSNLEDLLRCNFQFWGIPWSSWWAGKRKSNFLESDLNELAAQKHWLLLKAARLTSDHCPSVQPQSSWCLVVQCLSPSEVLVYPPLIFRTAWDYQEWTTRIGGKMRWPRDKKIYSVLKVCIEHMFSVLKWSSFLEH